MSNSEQVIVDNIIIITIITMMMMMMMMMIKYLVQTVWSYSEDIEMKFGIDIVCCTKTRNPSCRDSHWSSRNSTKAIHQDN